METQRHHDLLSPMQEISGAELNGLFYIIGGIDANKKPSNEVQIYNPLNDSWHKGPNLPRKLHHAAAVELNGKIYSIGGFETVDGAFAAVDSSYVLEDGNWSEIAKMTTKRGGLSAVSFEGKIYAIGGSSGTNSVSVVEVYSPEANEWREHSYMNFARDHLASFVIDNTIYAAGGRDSKSWPFSNKDDIEYYDSNLQKWKKLDIKISPRSGMAFFAKENQIYLFGGETAAQVIGSFEEIDINSGKTAEIKSNLKPRHGFFALEHNGQIYFIGGADRAGYGVTGLVESIELH